jgi:hypothetical protein
MLVSILRSIAFQGPGSRNLNLRQSQICIVGIYGHRLSNGAFFLATQAVSIHKKAVFQCAYLKKFEI